MNMVSESEARCHTRQLSMIFLFKCTSYSDKCGCHQPIYFASHDITKAPTRATVDTLSANNLKSTVTYSNPVVMTLAPKAVPTSMDWRRQQKVDTMMNAMTQNSTQFLAQLSQREHSAGIRQPGCPCCDPDNPANYVDSMMML